MSIVCHSSRDFVGRAHRRSGVLLGWALLAAGIASASAPPGVATDVGSEPAATDWSALGGGFASGPSNSVQSVVTYGTVLVAAGSFHEAGGVAVSNVAS